MVDCMPTICTISRQHNAMNPISISDLEQAINAARSAEPASGSEAALSGDVAVLADIYGQLIYRGHKMFDADSLDASQRSIVLHWLEAARAARVPGRAA